MSGVLAHNPSNLILVRSLVALFGCYFVGLVLGVIGEFVIRQHLLIYTKSNPVPDVKPLSQEPVIVAEIAEDQSAPLPPAPPVQVSQPAQTAQPAPPERKAA